MTKETITGIKIARNRKIPDKTEVILRNTGGAGHIGAKLKLPWQKEYTDLGILPIVNNEVVLPLQLAFLCHAKDDRTQVEAVGSKLLADGFLTWFDEKDLLPGDDWQQEIEKAIETCDFFLAFLSRTSCAKTGYVQRELRYALEQRDRRPFGKRFVIPILIDECTPPREFMGIHFLRLWELGAYGKLKQALSEAA